MPGEALPVSDPGYITERISLTSCPISPLSVGDVRPLLHWWIKCPSQRSWPDYHFLSWACFSHSQFTLSFLLLFCGFSSLTTLCFIKSTHLGFFTLYCRIYSHFTQGLWTLYSRFSLTLIQVLHTCYSGFYSHAGCTHSLLRSAHTLGFTDFTVFTHPLLRVCEHISPGFLTLYFGLPHSLLQVCSQLIPGSLPHSNNPLCSVAGSEPPLRLLKAYQHGSSVEAKSGQCQPRHAHSAACLQAASLPAQVQSCCRLEKEKKNKIK